MGCPGKDICKARGLRNGHDGAYENYGHGRPRSGTRCALLLRIWASFLQRFSLLSVLFLWSVSCNETTSYRTTIAVRTFVLPYTAYSSLHISSCQKEVVHWAVPSGFAAKAPHCIACYSIAPHHSNAAQQQPGPSPAFSLKLSPSLLFSSSSHRAAGQGFFSIQHCCTLSREEDLSAPWWLDPLALTLSILASSIAIGSTKPPRSRSL